MALRNDTMCHERPFAPTAGEGWSRPTGLIAAWPQFTETDVGSASDWLCRAHAGDTATLPPAPKADVTPLFHFQSDTCNQGSMMLVHILAVVVGAFLKQRERPRRCVSRTAR